MSDNPPNVRRQILIAVFAAISIIGITIPFLYSLLVPTLGSNEPVAAPTTTSTTKSGLVIRPVSVRPVISAFVTTPDKCPPPAIGAPPDQPLKTCDVNRTAIYDLAPEGVRLQLTNVESFKNPLTGANIAQLSMTEDASKAFTQYTKDHIDQQAAFVRSGIVVWAPKISEPIEGQVLQLTGDLTLEEVERIANMIKDGGN